MAPLTKPEAIERQIITGTGRGHKEYAFDEAHDPRRPVQYWFQESTEGRIFFIVFYSQACRWSRCLGCNLPARMSRKHIGFRDLMAQVDFLFQEAEVRREGPYIRKVIVSNNGSVLDEATFSSTALIYLIAKLNLHLPRLEALSLETRIEYVDIEELEFIGRALAEGDASPHLELAVGFEAFDEHVRNAIFQKGLPLHRFEELCRVLSRYGFRLKCYFMQKPVPQMTDAEAVRDIHDAIDYLSQLADQTGTVINLHLNPTYVAFGTPLESSFLGGEYEPPRLLDVARAALRAEDKPITLFLGLSDEGLACEGGSFLRPGETLILEALEHFNRTQDFRLLKDLLADRGS